MRNSVTVGDNMFEVTQDLVDVTSNHRPNTNWRVVDSKRHVHHWYEGGRLARSYNPNTRYTTPTLRWVKDGEEYWEDDDQPHDVGHLECDQCGEHVEPGYTADSITQHIGGITYFRVNGESVSKDEFERRYTEAIRARA